MVRQYAPKYDLWLVVAVLSTVFIPLALGTVAISIGDVWPGVIGAFGGVLLIVVVLLGLAWPVRYVLDGATLRVRAGWWLRWEVPVASIEEVIPVRTAYSSPAWSVDKLQVSYRRCGELDFLLIAPRDRHTFLDDLARLDAELEWDEHELRRR
jgi:hypothetical protein